MHVICPHCQNAIERDSKDAYRDIVCPSCGSSFHLEHGETTAWTPQAGSKKLGKFELLDLIGIGAFGSVYKGRDTQLERVVAIKVPRSGSLSCQEDLDRFLREARSVAQIRHPGIVPVYEVGQHEGVPFLVSEFVPGVTLADLLTARKPSFETSARLIADVADALQYAHERGVVHRDVKPSNILLGEGDQPHLTDFGLAKRDAGEVTMTTDGQVLGTPAYMSPEQARGDSHLVDGRSDVYSLGVILYQLATGELPFRGNARMLQHQVLHDEPRAPRSLNDRIPRDLETICLKAMAKEPPRRYASAADLAADLHRFLKSEPILARPVGKWERFERWCRRNHTVAALSAAVVTILIVATAISTTLAWRLHTSLEATEAYARNEEKARLDVEAAFTREQTEHATAIAARSRAEEQQRLADSERSRAEETLYFNRIALAERYFSANNVGLADIKLDECPPGLHHWEWHHLRRRCHAELETSAGPYVAPGRPVSFSRDGQRCAVVTTFERFNQFRIPSWSVQVWDVGRGQVIYEIDDFLWTPVEAAVLSPDGKLLAAVSGGSIRIWDIAASKETASLAAPEGTWRCLAFSADNSRVAAGDRAIKIWEVATGRELCTLPIESGLIDDIVFSPDGQFLASGGFNQVTLWKAQATTYQKELHDATPRRASVRRLLFSPDGRRVDAVWDNGDITALDVVNKGIKRHGVSGEAIIPGGVRGLAISPDGQRLATAHSDWTIRVLDAMTGQEQFTLRGHSAPVAGVAYRAGGNELVSVGEDRTIKVWDAVTGLQAVQVPGGSQAVAFGADGATIATVTPGEKTKLSIWQTATKTLQATLPAFKGEIIRVFAQPNGKHLNIASISLNENENPVLNVEIYDLNLKRIVQRLPRQNGLRPPFGTPPRVAFSSNGQRIATADRDKIVAIWDAWKPEPLLKVHVGFDSVQALALSHDGSLAAVGGRSPLSVLRLSDYIIQVRDVAHNKALFNFTEQTGDITCLAFSPAKAGEIPAFLASASNTTVQLWDLRMPAGGTVGEGSTRPPLYTLAGHTQPVRALTFSPDSRRLASVSFSSGRGELKLWDVVTGQEVLTLAEPGADVAFSSDGRRLAVAGNGNQVRILDGTPGPELLARREAGKAVAFSPDGYLLALSGRDASIEVFDVRAAHVVQMLKSKAEGTTDGHSRRVRQAVFHPQGTLLATCAEDGTIKLWDFALGTVVRTFTSHGGDVYAIAFSSDGGRLASAGADGTARIWSVADGKSLATFTGHTDRVLGVALSPDGSRAASCGDDRTVRVWDTDTGREAFQLARHEDGVFRVAFDPSGKLLASASQDRTIVLWNTQTGQALRTLTGHRDGVRDVCFSTDGLQLASAGWDKTVKVWDVATGRELQTLRGHDEGVCSVAIGRQGWLASAGGDLTLRIWKTSTPAHP